MIKSKIEAVLFLTDKPMKAAVIARTLNEDVQVVRQGLLELIHDYEERKSGLEVADDNGYIIQVKDEYSSLINEFAPLEVPLALLRTLSAIAIKQPVQQSEIIKIRGAGAYDHVKELMVRELVIKKEADEGQGRSPLLSTTKKFQEYFRLSGDGKSLRTELRKKDVREDRSATSDAESQLFVPLNFGDDVPADDAQGTYSEAASIDNLVSETLSEVNFAEQSKIETIQNVATFETVRAFETVAAVETVAAIQTSEISDPLEPVETVEAFKTESKDINEFVEEAQSETTTETSQVDELLSLVSDANQVDQLVKAAEEISQANDDLERNSTRAAAATERENQDEQDIDNGIINVLEAMSSATESKSNKPASAGTSASSDVPNNSSSTSEISEVEAVNNSEAVEALQELFDSSPDNSLIFRDEDQKKKNKSARSRQSRKVESTRTEETTSDSDAETENSSNTSTDAASDE